MLWFTFTLLFVFVCIFIIFLFWLGHLLWFLCLPLYEQLWRLVPYLSLDLGFYSMLLNFPDVFLHWEVDFFEFFFFNCRDLVRLLGGAVAGIHSMIDEHFGISVVEYMAAGAIPIGMHCTSVPIIYFFISFFSFYYMNIKVCINTLGHSFLHYIFLILNFTL